MILNGPENSMKGHVCDVNDPQSLPRYVRQHPSPDERVRLAIALNERYRIIEECGDCGSILIAEELLAHHMDHVPSRLRALVRTVMQANPEDRKEVIRYLNELEVYN